MIMTADMEVFFLKLLSKADFGEFCAMRIPDEKLNG